MNNHLVKKMKITFDYDLNPVSGDVVGTIVQTDHLSSTITVLVPGVNITKDTCYLSVRLPVREYPTQINIPTGLNQNFEFSHTDENGVNYYKAEFALTEKITRYTGQLPMSLVITNQDDVLDESDLEDTDAIAENYTSRSSSLFYLNVRRSSNFRYSEMKEDEIETAMDAISDLVKQIGSFAANYISKTDGLIRMNSLPGDLREYVNYLIFDNSTLKLYFVENQDGKAAARLLSDYQISNTELLDVYLKLVDGTIAAKRAIADKNGNIIDEHYLPQTKGNTSYDQAYGKAANGSQEMYNASKDPLKNHLIKRDEAGNFEVNVPTREKHPASKKYVDDEVEKEKANRILSLGNLESNVSSKIENVGNNLQSQIDAINAAQNLVDIVGSYNDLQNYDISNLLNNDKIEVLIDELHEDASTIYRFDGMEFVYIGKYKSDGYTRAESDRRFATLVDLANVNDEVLNAKNELDLKQNGIKFIDIGSSREGTLTNEQLATLQESDLNYIAASVNNQPCYLRYHYTNNKENNRFYFRNELVEGGIYEKIYIIIVNNETGHYGLHTRTIYISSQVDEKVANLQNQIDNIVDGTPEKLHKKDYLNKNFINMKEIYNQFKKFNSDTDSYDDINICSLDKDEQDNISLLLSCRIYKYHQWFKGDEIFGPFREIERHYSDQITFGDIVKIIDPDDYLDFYPENIIRSIPYDADFFNNSDVQLKMISIIVIPVFLKKTAPDIKDCRDYVRYNLFTEYNKDLFYYSLKRNFDKGHYTKWFPFYIKPVVNFNLIEYGNYNKYEYLAGTYGLKVLIRFAYKYTNNTMDDRNFYLIMKIQKVRLK